MTGQYLEHLILEPPPIGGCTRWDEHVQIKGGLAIYCVDIIATHYFLGPADGERMEFVKKVVA